MYPIFLDCGYTPSLFWDLSLAEVLDVIESKKRREKAEYDHQVEELKTQAIMNQVHARQIAEFLALSILGNENIKLTKLSEYFPDLFKDDSEKAANEQILLHKARMEEFAFWHNHKRKETKN